MDSEALAGWLSAEIPGWQSVRVDSIEEIAGGWESDVYDLRVQFESSRQDRSERLALRRYAGDGQVAQREFDGMRHLFSVGYPVPEVLALERSADVIGRPFMVMRWVEGAIRSWDAADLDALAVLLADLHRLDWQPLSVITSPPERASELISGWRTQLAAYPVDSLGACLDWAAQSAAAISLQPAIVHLDFHTGNVLVGVDGSATVIDWTQVGVADRRMDVAWTELLMSMALDRPAAARFRSAYERTAGRLEDMDWFMMASAAKRLFSVLVSVEVGPEAMGMRREARQLMLEDIHTLAVPWQWVRDITGIDVVEARRLFESGSS